MSHPTLEEQIVRRCVYYVSPIQSKCCEKGINYRLLAGGERHGYLARIPCVETALSKNVQPCEHKRLPTKEEITAEIESWKRHFEANGLEWVP